MDAIIITTEPIDVDALRAQLPAHPCCGAHVQFEGIVRNHNHGKAVTGIDYECFVEMAERELALIVTEAKTQWPIHDVLLAHRMGALQVGDVSLVLCVRAPHRAEAFAACAWIITALKKRVPIWKKERYADGHTEWTACTH